MDFLGLRRSRKRAGTAAVLLFARPVVSYHPEMDRIGIYRGAALLINRYGEDAALEAAARADDLLDEGDLDGARVAPDEVRNSPGAAQSGFSQAAKKSPVASGDSGT